MSDTFFCRDCGSVFDTPSSYEETHGFEYGPYESVAICPYCNSDDFVEFEPSVEKIEVAEQIVPIILKLNNYVSELENLYGIEIKNSDLLDSIDNAAEFISDLYDFMDLDLQRKLLKMKSETEAEKILMSLSGGI